MSDYGKLTVARLKEELDKRGLPKSGLKAALVQRLNEADAEAESDAPKAMQEEQGAEDQKANHTELDEDAPSTVVTRAIINGPTSTGNDLPIPPPTRTEDQLPVERVVETQEDDLALGTASIKPNVLPSLHDSSMSPTTTEGDATLSHPRVDILPGNLTQPIETSVLKTQLPSPIQTQSEDLLPSISTQASITGEEMEDSSKRKRRSQSPPPSSIETTKRLKADSARPKVELPEDSEKSVATLDPPISPDESHMNGNAVPLHAFANSIGPTGVPPEDATQTKGTDTYTKDSPSDTRFKNLFAPPARTSPPPAKDSQDRIISPALHPATSALYIRDLMRPLNPSTLRSHLAALATPPSSSPDPDTVTQFYLDSIRTHCLVGFSNVSAASRVRSGLHDRIWPSERDRKPLWVDFVPEEKLDKWIDVEQTTKSDRGQAAKRWEVVYETEDEEVRAYLQEIGTDSSGGRIGQQSASAPMPDTVQSSREAPSGPRIKDLNHNSRQPRGGASEGKGFQALDDIFRSTVAKPKLYFLPAPKSEAARRVELLAAGRGGGRSDELRRFSFEEDRVVDRGPEFGRSGRGGLGRRGGGFDRGGQWGRGGRPYRGGGASDRRGENRSRYGQS